MSFIKESQTPTDTKTNIIITNLFEKEDEVETKQLGASKIKKTKMTNTKKHRRGLGESVEDA